MTICLVITGAAGELGRRALDAAVGRKDIDLVVATTRSRRLAAAGARCVGLEGLDLRDETGTARLAGAVAAANCTRLALLHCAGAFPSAAALHRTSHAAVADTFGANVLTFLGAARAVIPSMRRLGSGGIVAFTSHTQAAAYPFLGAFNMSKVALLSAIQTVANENARFGIAANAIAVATLQTETERRIKPGGPYEDWVPVDSVAPYAIDLALAETNSVNGSEIQYWRYSRSFFGASVLERNSLDPAVLDPDHD